MKIFDAKAQRRKGRRKVKTSNSSLRLPLRLCAFASKKSPIINALGLPSFAEFHAVTHPGKILWCNFDLLRELGFSVPETNQLTPELNEQLLATLSLRSVNGEADLNHNGFVKLYADKYGGDGVHPALGAGRAGFLPHGNLYIKGLGFTPLFRHYDKDDFVHSHGGVHFEDCLSEAVFSEVTHHLFTLGANRIVAIIDQGKYVTAPSGRRRHIALAVRAGPQLRPGHLLAKRARGSRSAVEAFVEITRATNQLVTKNGTIADVSATMLRVIDDHAQAAADSFRWRMIHGALSPSNMDISGAMLDLPTQSTQPRTAPIFKLDYVGYGFGTEHKQRGFYLAEMYRRVLRVTSPAIRERLNAKWINVSHEMDQAYDRHLQVKLLAATGVKTALAQNVHTHHPELAGSFTKLLLEMAALKNRGSACVARKVVEDVSIVDVFNLLGSAPREYFKGELPAERVVKNLRPVYKGNRFQIAKRRAQVAAFAREFIQLYSELMTVCASYAADYYDGPEAMKDSITARAAFENEPIDALYCHPLYENLNAAIAKYKITGRIDLVREVIDKAVWRSLRSVDGLLAQGESRLLDDGGIELQRRTIRGISYSVRAWENCRRVSVRIPMGFGGSQYRFTVDGKTWHEVQGRVKSGQREFEFGVSKLIGRVEGYFVGNKSKTRRFTGYSFVIPDKYDLKTFLAQRRKGAKEDAKDAAKEYAREGATEGANP